MSLEASAHVWKNSKQKGTKLLLLVAIADYTNAEGWAWPSIKSLCQRTRMGERYVQSMIREIVEDGELEVKERKNASNYFRIKGVEEWGVNHSSPGGEAQCALGVNQDAPNPLEEPSTNHKGAPPLVLVAEPVLNGHKRSKDDLYVDLLPQPWLTDFGIAEAWKGFVDMRSRKFPLTDRAVKLIVNKVRSWKREDIIGGLDEATVKHYRDVFQPKQNGQHASSTSGTGKVERVFEKFLSEHQDFKRRYKNYQDAKKEGDHSPVMKAFHPYYHANKASVS